MAPPYTAYLRVYEPLHAFPPAEQEQWRAYTSAGRAPSTLDGPRIEHTAAIGSLVAVRAPKPEEQAFVRVCDGVTLICPWRTSMRAAETAAEVRSSVASVLADAFVPQSLADAASADADAFRADHPDARPHMMVANWSVPVRWFVLVDAAERQLRLRSGERSLLYLTEMAQARRRSARALAVLRKALGEGTGVAETVEELARWLEDFHPRSMVELDYGGVTDLLSDDALRDDRSAEDVADALAGLAEEDEDRARAAYERVVGRWRPVQLIESAN